MAGTGLHGQLVIPIAAVPKRCTSFYFHVGLLDVAAGLVFPQQMLMDSVRRLRGWPLEKLGWGQP